MVKNNGIIDKVAIWMMIFILVFSAVLFAIFYKVDGVTKADSIPVMGEWSSKLVDENFNETKEPAPGAERHVWVEFTVKMPENVENYTHLYLTAYYGQVKVFIGDRQVYEDDKINHFNFSEINSKRYMFIDLPKDWQGEELRIYVNTYLDLRNFDFDDPILCYKDSMLQVIFQEAIPIILILNIFLLMGVIYILFFISLRKTRTVRNKLLYIGAISISSGLYLVSQLNIASLMSRNNTSMYVLEMSTSLIMMFPLILIFKETLNKEVQKILNMTLFLNLANVVIQAILTIKDSITFRQLNVVTNIIYLITMTVILLISLVGLGMEKKERRDLRITFIPVSILWLAIGVFSIFKPDTDKKYFVILGTIYILVTQTTFSLREIRIAYAKKAAAAVYEEMAYADLLTGLRNRNAFERDHVLLNKESLRLDGRYMFVIMIDVNGLKKINDNHGHMAGDKLIKTMADYLNKYFKNTDWIYRLGGDEFVVVFETWDGNKAEDILSKMKDEAAQKPFFENYLLSFSYGAVKFDRRIHNDIEDAIKDADARMYEQKIRYYENEGDENRIKIGNAKK